MPQDRVQWRDLGNTIKNIRYVRGGQFSCAIDSFSRGPLVVRITCLHIFESQDDFLSILN
jgi:hypothetical protein